MSRFHSAAALAAVALVAYSFGTANTPPKQAQAAPVVVGSPPGELARLESLVAELQAARETDREQILRLEESLAVAKAAPKSTCLGGLCESCQCPGDGRCAKKACHENVVQNVTASPPVYAATSCSGGGCATYSTYQPARRFKIFGRRR